MTARRGTRATLATLALTVWTISAGAQSVRITGSTSVRYIELRTLIRDSVTSTGAPGEGLLRQLADGRVVRCVPGEAWCRDVRPGPRASTLPALHDLDMTAWGFGRGVRLVAQFRARTSFGGAADLWPRADDEFDVLSLYGEVERDRVRARVGRQWRTSGLGFYNFDGVTVGGRPVRATWLEAWVGRSLVRGLNEARTAPALESIEPLAGLDAGLLAGVQVRYRPSGRLALSAQYQVDMRGDRRSLYSELASADAVVRSRHGTAEAAVEVDAATGATNLARLVLRSRPLGRVTLSTEARRFRPYFEQWTIWGAFSPVGFDEARAAITWAPGSGTLLVRGDATYRAYQDPEVVSTPDRLETKGWGVGSTVTWSPSPTWRMDGAYRVDAGFGAARRDAQAGITRLFGPHGSIGVQATWFERLYEFRIGEGQVGGLVAEGGWRIQERLRASGHAMLFRHFSPGASAINWTQRRALLRLEWTVGRDAEGRVSPGGTP